MVDTSIDIAFEAHAADPDNEPLYLRFLERLMDGELLLLLETVPEGERASPQIFDLEQGRFVLVFDSNDRMATFLEEPAPCLELPGRRLMDLLAGQGLGIALNLGVAPSSTLLSAETIDWMEEMSRDPAAVAEVAPSEIRAPGSLPADVLSALDAKLAIMADRIGEAHLVESRFTDDSTALLLVLVGVPEAARPNVAAAISEAMRFSGAPGTKLDVTFLDTDARALERIRRVSVQLELPRPAAPQASMTAPGSNPEKPPILR